MADLRGSRCAPGCVQGSVWTSVGRTIIARQGPPVTNADNESSSARWGHGASVGRLPVELDKLLAARDQTEHLLRAIFHIGSGHDLDSTLHHVVGAALGLTGCRHCALATCECGRQTDVDGSRGVSATRPPAIHGPPPGNCILEPPWTGNPPFAWSISLRIRQAADFRKG